MESFQTEIVDDRRHVEKRGEEEEEEENLGHFGDAAKGGSSEGMHHRHVTLTAQQHRRPNAASARHLLGKQKAG